MTVNPASGSFEETLWTLYDTYRTKTIKKSTTVNKMIAKNVLLNEDSEQIAKLKRELDANLEMNGVYLSAEEFHRTQRKNS